MRRKNSRSLAAICISTRRCVNLQIEPPMVGPIKAPAPISSQANQYTVVRFKNGLLTSTANSAKAIEEEWVNTLYWYEFTYPRVKFIVHTMIGFRGSVSRFPKYAAPPARPNRAQGMVTACRANMNIIWHASEYNIPFARSVCSSSHSDSVATRYSLLKWSPPPVLGFSKSSEQHLLPLTWLEQIYSEFLAPSCVLKDGEL